MKTETLETVEATAALSPSQDGPIETEPPLINLKSILVPLDFSERSLKALQYAVPLAKQFGAKLTLLHVLKGTAVNPVNIPYLASLDHQRLTVIEKKLEDMIPPDLPVETTVRQSFVLDAILEVAVEVAADLIITTTHGYTGLQHVFKGSTAESVVRRAPCPVLVVHDHERDFVAPGSW